MFKSLKSLVLVAVVIASVNVQAVKLSVPGCVKNFGTNVKTGATAVFVDAPKFVAGKGKDAGLFVWNNKGAICKHALWSFPLAHVLVEAAAEKLAKKEGKKGMKARFTNLKGTRNTNIAKVLVAAALFGGFKFVSPRIRALKIRAFFVSAAPSSTAAGAFETV